MSTTGKVILVFVALLCGGNSANTSPDFSPEAAPALPSTIKIAVLGNSITRHKVAPELQWSIDAGMAASDLSHDYSHQLMRITNTPLDKAYIRNFYPFESGPDEADSAIATLKPMIERHPEAVVIELGDNVESASTTKLSGFSVSYNKLLDTVGKRPKIYCLSTFWTKASVDQIIRNTCASHGGRYVDIGDIFRAGNPGTKFSNPGVDKHPKDAAMLTIAQRIATAMKGGQITTMR